MSDVSSMCFTFEISMHWFGTEGKKHLIANDKKYHESKMRCKQNWKSNSSSNCKCISKERASGRTYCKSSTNIFREFVGTSVNFWLSRFCSVFGNLAFCATVSQGLKTSFPMLQKQRFVTFSFSVGNNSLIFVCKIWGWHWNYAGKEKLFMVFSILVES